MGRKAAPTAFIQFLQANLGRLDWVGFAGHRGQPERRTGRAYTQIREY